MSFARRMRRKQQRSRKVVRLDVFAAAFLLAALAMFLGGAAFHVCAHRAALRPSGSLSARTSALATEHGGAAASTVKPLGAALGRQFRSAIVGRGTRRTAHTWDLQSGALLGSGLHLRNLDSSLALSQNMQSCEIAHVLRRILPRAAEAHKFAASIYSGRSG